MNLADDPSHPNNSTKHHTGELCVEGCGRPAGTAWSPFWCRQCNATRLHGVSLGLHAATNHLQQCTTPPDGSKGER